MADVTDPNGVVCDQSLVDALGYCNGDATQDCAGHPYSPSNEDGNTYTDPRGVSCYGSFSGWLTNSGSVDYFGYCCGDATPSCGSGDYYSLSGEGFPIFVTVTDPRGISCLDYYADPLGYCCGDAGYPYYPVDCAGRPYSPSNEDGNTYTDPRGVSCYGSFNGFYQNSGSVDVFGYCCGDATFDCAGNFYSPSNEDGGTYTHANSWPYCNGELCNEFCNKESADGMGVCCGDAVQDCTGGWISPSGNIFPAYVDPNGAICGSDIDGLGYCCGDATQDCAGNYYSPSNEDGNTYTDPRGTACSGNSIDGLGYCCGDATQDCAGNYYSPSNEDGNTYTDPRGMVCSIGSVGFDVFGYCCGTCNDLFACGEDAGGCLYDFGLGAGCAERQRMYSVIPPPNTVLSGVVYGSGSWVITGTYIPPAASTPRLNIGPLIGLPAFIQL